VTVTVKFGVGQSCEIALGEHTRLAPALETAGESDPAAAMRAALAAPRGFPPVAAAVVPGDCVAIALGRAVPQAAGVLRGAVLELVHAGVEPANITIVSAEPFDETQPATMQTIAKLAAEGVQFAVHNPDDELGIAMVGLTAKHEPLRLNRTIAEADLVLPISTARPARRDGGPAKFGGLFPRFSNRETADRFHGRGKSATPARFERRVAEADEAGWLLGVGMVVVIVPGPSGGVAEVIAGEPAIASREAAAQFQAIWERATERLGDLVIAAVAGNADEQTWDNFAKAVSASEKVRSPEGAIAVCCDIAEAPAGAFDELRDAVDYAEVVGRLRGHATPESKPALVLAQALERGPVYLRSRVPAEVVESLGMTPIENDVELSRLAAGRRHCVVIEEAQRVRPRLVGGGGPT
jgi:nickel-dependent lactate racemase